jgi:hypothetical protein
MMCSLRLCPKVQHGGTNLQLAWVAYGEYSRRVMPKMQSAAQSSSSTCFIVRTSTVELQAISCSSPYPI